MRPAPNAPSRTPGSRISPTSLLPRNARDGTAWRGIKYDDDSTPFDRDMAKRLEKLFEIDEALIDRIRSGHELARQAVEFDEKKHHLSALDRYKDALPPLVEAHKDLDKGPATNRLARMREKYKVGRLVLTILDRCETLKSRFDDSPGPGCSGPPLGVTEVAERQPLAISIAQDTWEPGRQSYVPMLQQFGCNVFHQSGSPHWTVSSSSSNLERPQKHCRISIRISIMSSTFPDKDVIQKSAADSLAYFNIYETVLILRPALVAVTAIHFVFAEMDNVTTTTSTKYDSIK